MEDNGEKGITESQELKWGVSYKPSCEGHFRIWVPK